MNLPRHPRAKELHSSGLFSDVQSFSQLEEKIADLPTGSDKGAAFEVFTEACLATQRVYQTREVWPGDSMPSSVRQQLRLPLIDMGIDGVFVTTADEAVSYQSKFRNGRPSLTWTELSTFYGLADGSEMKLVFTNCDIVSKVAEERLGAIFVRGSDLDRLTGEDFSIIESWLGERPATIKRKDPKPHQVAALQDIVSGLARNKRATALMACGSGKTLVALWAAEKLDARTTLVLLPSLALVRQSLHEWLREASWPNVQFLCVCSDATVHRAEDSLTVRPAELDFAVTTDSSKVRRFLDCKTDAIRLVFSTYHSSHVVAEATKGLAPFDFGVFDEAHKTAGRDGLRFSAALKDENIPIARRLFLTATPRHYDVARKDKFGESKIVYSMDAPDAYGPVVHQLSFSKAAKEGIITDYKVIISVVTSEMVTDEALRRGIVIVQGDEIKARQVANQIALKSAIENYGVSKVFTFHSRVVSAKSFTAAGSEGIETHLDDFHATHIEGAMSTAYRERLLREFASAPRAVLSNARCLTEGVDVPAVDMVAFMSPKRSLVDIVQAAGRAMRLSPDTNKKFGYVLVPLYVEKARGETIEQAVLRSNFDEVWEVLQGLKEQDDLLAQVIADMRIAKGRTGGFDDTRFRERVHILGPEISLEVLRQTISAACLEMVGETWFERYGQLNAYKDTHGDCDIPARYSINKKLAVWVVDQRVRYRDGVLESEKIELLNRIGFKWEPRASSWREKYLELIEYKRRYSNCTVPQDWPENPQLAKWVSRQRLVYSRGKISQERIAQLDKIGFEWTVGLESWDARFSELCAFKERFGHTRVRAKYPENPALGHWVTSQRHDRRRNKLEPARIERLDSIEFEWDGRIAGNGAEASSVYRDKQWKEMFERLKAYAAVNGAKSVKVVDDNTKRLNRWMLFQRAQKKRGKLTDIRISMLDELGFEWQRSSNAMTDDATVDSKLSAQSWDEMYGELVEFYKVHGHSNVPNDWTALPVLARWVNLQRVARREDRLTVEQADQLNAISFAWTVYDGEWELMFKKLSEYLSRAGSGKGRNRRPSTGLNRWMQVQRQLRKKGELNPNREQRLNNIEFEWEPFSARWAGMYSRLRAYWEKNGNCRVPAKWSEDTKLANWVQTQRAEKAQGKLSAERSARLEEITFEWSQGVTSSIVPSEAWDVMFGELCEYHRVHGHSSVPQAFAENKKLGWWVSTQRQRFRKGLLTDGQIKRLGELDFEWASSNRSWNQMFERLVDHLAKTPRSPKEGHIQVELRRFMLTQRQLMKRGLLSDDRKRKLDEVNFEWSPFSTAWDKMYFRLEIYNTDKGHCRVPAKWPLDPKLANWVATQRTRRSTGKLASERVDRLNALGFDWNPGRGSKGPCSPQDSQSARTAMTPSIGSWDELFLELLNYKKTFGDCLVPRRWNQSPSLADWVSRVRIANSQGELGSEAYELLSNIGFDWDPIGRRWEEKFNELIRFKEHHGHTNVPQRIPKYKELANWVRNQRRAKLKNSASFLERSNRLEEIGFQWRLKTRHIWDEMFDKLLAFRNIHGHCNVPQKWAENKKLGRWVNTLRIHHNRGSITDPERIRRLESIGFVWNTKPENSSNESVRNSSDD